ncbi:MAG: hypothetical protein CVV23_15570 [Ignavibacteriae bacterium HGW-Ignavibacteriae-2]|jgi:hypothetical protein|nr:MAG: hypothetical protein CVV23_15570 [Ignavibacteriae bacterium HGW-Ignavibacteriae-2]
MKKINLIVTAIILIFLYMPSSAQTQEFIVEKVTGKVSILRGTDENYQEVKSGQILNGTDLLVTDENSFIQLSRNGGRFLLKANSALGLNFIKAISINDLLLALTAEEVRSIPKNNSATAKNTAVYGKKIGLEKNNKVNDLNFGLKKLNGARQLAESGYKESAVLVAKETYRKYPSTKSRVDERIYFADLLLRLGLKNEALSEYSDIKSQQLTIDQKNSLNKKIEEVSLAVTSDK